MRIPPFFCFLAIAAAGVAAPTLARAGEEEPPSIINYGVSAFWSGAQIGLASGYLATGRDYEPREWRKLVFGAGVGALAGTALGLTLGVVDAGGPPPGTGWLALRDTGYGIGLGALVGTATGALFLINSGDPKNLVTGAAFGSLIGAGVGAAVGIIQGASMHREHPVPASAKEQVTLRFTVTSSPDTAMLLPAINGSF